MFNKNKANVYIIVDATQKVKFLAHNGQAMFFQIQSTLENLK